MFNYLTQLRTLIQQIKADAEAARTAISQLIDLVENGPSAP